ncbi:MAG TPA: response regulator transcription factor [Streptosporangiaceae bacterium]|nr:response regulator transcription factor [Streptosporangiaceae bacterium]
MAARLTVSERDLRTLLDIVTVGRSDDCDRAPTGLPPSMLADLLDEVGGDCITFIGLDSTQSVTWSIQGEPTAEFLDNPDGFWHNFWACVSCSYPERTGDLRSVTTISDFYSARQWHSTGHYGENVGPAGLEHKVQVCLPPSPLQRERGPGRSVQLAIWRGRGTDFSGRDRMLLELLRPHLYEAYVEAERRRAGTPRLTPRQCDLLRLVAAGYTNRQVGSRLGISQGTVRKHLENIYERLGVSNRIAAVNRALGDLSGR